MRNWTKNICIVLLLCWVSWSSVVMIPRWLVNAMEWARGTLRWWGSFTIVTTTPRCFHFQRHHNHNHNNNHNHLQRHHLPHNLLSQVSFNQFFLRPLQLFSLAYCSLEYWKVRVFSHCSKSHIPIGIFNACLFVTKFLIFMIRDFCCWYFWTLN